MTTDIAIDNGANLSNPRHGAGTPTEHYPTGWVSQKVNQQRGHLATYIGLLLFTVVAYVKPENFTPPPFIAMFLAVVTILLFIPEQLRLEGRLTARPREVNILLLFCLTALLSMPLAQSKAEALREFNNIFSKAVVMFIVMINVVRTEQRLKGLLAIALAVALLTSGSAINSFRTGTDTLEGYRATGLLGGILLDPNDMALYIVSILPITVALALSARTFIPKVLLCLCAVTMLGGIVVTYSRGGFLALIAVILVFAFKLSRRRPAVGALTLMCLVGIFFMAPGNYAGRLASITNTNLDETGSANERRDLLVQSIEETFKHPVFGLGIGNFYLVTERGKPTHNAYTQVSSEMGIPALILYMMFIIVPLMHLHRIEQETFRVEGYSRFYFLAIGLQAGLVGYMIGSFFLSVAFYWFIYYLVAYAVCLRRVYETGPGRIVGQFAFTPPGDEMQAQLVHNDDGVITQAPGRAEVFAATATDNR